MQGISGKCYISIKDIPFVKRVISLEYNLQFRKKLKLLTWLPLRVLKSNSSL